MRIGISSAATVLEGRATDPDRLSIWDVFAAAPGRVTDASSPANGSRHLQFWESDVRLLADLGVDVYRFSLPWSVLTEADSPNWDFYDALVDALRAAGIAPMVTLTHYDMPLAVMEDGGWLTGDAGRHFTEYASNAATRLADRVEAWVTMNSPLVHTAYGYGLGIEAPGLTLLAGSLVAAQHQLNAHTAAVSALRAAGASTVGIANLHAPVIPDSSDPEDVHAATLLDAMVNRAFTDPLFGLPWPDELDALPGAEAIHIDAAVPLDFYGVNYYHPLRVRAADNATIPFTLVDPAAGERVDDFGWPIDPAALTTTLTSLSQRLPQLPPLWVTENGTQDTGGRDDEHRSAFLEEHLDAVYAALAAGVDIRGYLHWTLLDGWEFAEGLTRRFGLVEVDPQSGERRPKASYRRLQTILRERTGGSEG